nr:hypothetical protein CFP56_30657 [Quercus suber]
MNMMKSRDLRQHAEGRTAKWRDILSVEDGTSAKRCQRLGVRGSTNAIATRRWITEAGVVATVRHDRGYGRALTLPSITRAVSTAGQVDDNWGLKDALPCGSPSGSCEKNPGSGLSLHRRLIPLSYTAILVDQARVIATWSRSWMKRSIGFTRVHTPARRGHEGCGNRSKSSPETSRDDKTPSTHHRNRTGPSSVLQHQHNVANPSMKDSLGTVSMANSVRAKVYSYTVECPPAPAQRGKSFDEGFAWDSVNGKLLSASRSSGVGGDAHARQVLLSLLYLGCSSFDTHERSSIIAGYWLSSDLVCTTMMLGSVAACGLGGNWSLLETMPGPASIPLVEVEDFQGFKLTPSSECVSIAWSPCVSTSLYSAAGGLHD